MANFGLSFPTIAKLDVETGKYSEILKCGSAINTSVTPNYNEASLFADNRQKESVKEFKNANVELGVDTVPVKAVELLLGHKVAEDGTETSHTDDSGSYVGYGFITEEIHNGIKRFRACFLTKVKFNESAESYQTKGDSIQFGNPALNGISTSNDKGVWRIKSPYFDSETECDAWILQQFGKEEQTESEITA